MTAREASDVVVVLPGIMGSELVDAATGRVLWGMANVDWYRRAWMSPTGMAELMVTPAERAGDTTRITATRLLRFPAFAPMLRGFEPYTALTGRLRHVVREPGRVVEFPYDWRLSIEHNARQLMAVVERLAGNGAQLVLVAHSMGGLIARYCTDVLGGAAVVRTVITLGTPFHGAAKAAVLLSHGTGAPIPLHRKRLRAFAATLPGLHDLLPTYRVVDDGTSARRLTSGDIARLGGDAELAAESFARRARLLAPGSAGSVAWWPLVGVEQDTAQSLVLCDGTVLARPYACLPDADGSMRRVDRRGDGTVYRDAAYLAGGGTPAHLPQTHGALASCAEAVAHVCAVVTDRPLGPWLAEGTPIGLRVPDVVPAAAPFRIDVDGSADPTPVTCRISDAGDGRTIDRPPVRRADGNGLTVTARLPVPGLYRVEVKAGGFSAVTELVLVTGSDE
jgi:hypothetical protein